MTVAASLLLLALLGQPQPRTYYWRDAAGQTHITNTPPPSDAEVLDAPPPPAVEPGKPGRPELIRQGVAREGQPTTQLSPAQRQAWEALAQHLAKARASGDTQTLTAVTNSLIRNCLWGNGLWLMTLVPVLTLVLLSLLGWWLALGLQAGVRLPVLAAFLVLGLSFAQVFLALFLYHPQATRLRQNLELLEGHNGTGRALRPENLKRLRAQYQALEAAAEPLRAPWRFPAEVAQTREVMHQVMVAP